MPVSCVVEHAGFLSGADLWQHGGQHGAQARPWHAMFGGDVWKEVFDPFGQRLHTVIADVEVVAVELCGACDSGSGFCQDAR